VGRSGLELPAGVTTGAVGHKPSGRRGGRTVLAAAIALLLTAGNAAAGAGDVTAIYSAFWAGLPAAQIRLKLSEAGASYHDEIEIRTDGLPYLVTHFHGNAQAVGRLISGRPADPTRYDALFDLRKRRHNHVGMRFVARDGATVAERSVDDTSRNPPLAERYRRDIVDPLSAFERIRAAIAAREAAPNATFVVPVYDGARRFDVLGHILPKDQQSAGVLRVVLSLRPVAGFKGESSEDDDPDDAPRPVALTLTNDSRLLPVSMTVRVFYLPLVVRLDHICPGANPCSG
jgi:Protein of unknown function (DUF3108)